MPVLLFLLVLCAGVRDLVAQGSGEIELPRLPFPIRLDGDLSDSAWSRIPAVPLTLYTPTFRGTPQQKTEIRVAYDDEYLYAAGWLYDSDPKGIRVNSLYRDRWSGDDTFVLVVDGFNDNENALWFYTNPAGVRMDNSLSANGQVSNDSWNGVWDVATRITSEGWFAEMRIPLSTIGFQERDGKVVMGLVVSRLIARSNERVTFPAIDPRYPFRQPSTLQDVVLRGVTPQHPVYVAPYLLSGMDRTTALPPGALAYGSNESFVREAGGDLKYGVGDNFHLDLSVNTDFAQVEADDQQVNLTRFPLFFPEKRQFFQERAGLFDFALEAGGRLFHSRQIGLASDGTPIRMLGGSRVVARTGGLDVAALDVQAARRGAIPSENLGVLRLKRRVVNDFSYAGGMLTSRRSEDGTYNVATGLDASVKVFGDDYFTVRGASTFDDADQSPSLLNRTQIFTQWQRRSNTGLNYFAQLHRVGADYKPGLGFLPRTNFSRAALYSEYNVRPKHSVFESYGPGAIGFFFFDNDGGALQTYYMAYWWNYAFHSGAAGWLEVIHNYEAVPGAFALGNGVSVEPGTFKFTEVWFNYSPGGGSLLRSGVDARLGGFYDGWRGKITLSPTWNLSRFLELGGSYEYNHIRFPDRNTGLDTHVGRLRVGAAANARLSAVALIQVNSVDRHAGVNLRLRYNFREGSDLWVVYDEGFNTDREPEIGEPRLPLSSARVMRVKLTHTFVW